MSISIGINPLRHPNVGQLGEMSSIRIGIGPINERVRECDKSLWPGKDSEQHLIWNTPSLEEIKKNILNWDGI